MVILALFYSVTGFKASGTEPLDNFLWDDLSILLLRNYDLISQFFIRAELLLRLGFDNALASTILKSLQSNIKLCM